MLENPKAAKEQLMKMGEGRSSRNSYFGAQINYYWTPAVPLSELLPKRLSALADSKTAESRDAIAVDVVIARRAKFDEPAELEIVRETQF